MIDNNDWRSRQRPTRSQSAHVEHQRGKPGQPVGSQIVASLGDLVADVGEQGLVHHLPDVLALLVEVEHLDEVRALSGQLLEADRVDVQLVARDVLSLGALGGLEVDD